MTINFDGCDALWNEYINGILQWSDSHTNYEVLDEGSCLWVAPVVMPTDDKQYSWDEESQSWKLVE
jgi:hypothetical protein